MISKNTLSAYFLVILLNLFYLFVVFDKAFDPNFGDFGAYSASFIQYEKIGFDSLLSRIWSLLVDDIFFYLFWIYVVGLSDYEEILFYIFVFNSIFISFFVVRNAKYKPFFSQFLLVLPLIHPKVTELFFFNVRQGMSVALVLTGLYMLQNNMLKIVLAFLGQLLHGSTVVLIAMKLARFFLDYLKIKLDNWLFIFIIFTGIFVPPLVLEVLFDRFSNQWPHRDLYTLFVFVIVSVFMLLVVWSKEKVFKLEIVFLCSLIVSGIVFNLSSDRLIGVLLLFSFFRFSHSTVVNSVIFVENFVLVAFTVVSLFFWL